jgi:regulator of protease activity HflC (stomatin/prohibitin superfamily)
MGISSVTSLLGLLGFIILIVGIAGAVLASSQGRPPRNGVLLAVVGLVMGIVFSVVSQGLLVLQPREVAVVFNTLSGNLSEQPLRSGTHIVVPVLQQVTIYPIEQQQYTMSGNAQEGSRPSNDSAVQARTTDGQEVSLDITVLYAINPDNANIVHTRWQNRYQEDFIRPTVRGFTRDVVSGYRAQDIYGAERGQVEQDIQERLAVRMEEEGLTLTDLLVRNINFSDQFTNAIEQAQIAQQESERARLRVQQIQQEAEQARAQAEGQRDAAVARAEGDAQSIILRAQAQAEALRLVSEQIAANPALIQYEYVQQLSDNVRLVMVPSNSPFLFDLESIAQSAGAQDGEFVAPAVPQPQDIVPVEPTPTPAPGN